MPKRSLRQVFFQTGRWPAFAGPYRTLQAAGENGRTIRSHGTRLALDRLANGGYLVARQGQKALAEYDKSGLCRLTFVLATERTSCGNTGLRCSGQAVFRPL